MAAVTLGDFLRIANDQFETAASRQGRGLVDATGSVHHVRRIVTALGRCFDGAPLGNGQAEPIVVELRRAMATARSHLEVAEANLGVLTDTRPTPRLRVLANAADVLTAGADLIDTHTSSDVAGQRVDRSDWAPVLRSGPLRGALVAEAAHWAEQLAPMCAGLSGRPALRDRHASICLTAAARCLSDAAAMATALGSEDREDWWKLLAGIPVAAAPPRREPVPGESVDELCDGITGSADRLRVLAFTMPDRAGWGPDISAPAWRRAAQFAMSTSRVIRFAVEGAAGDGDASWQVADLALSAAYDAWQQATGVWQVMATDTTTPVSAVTIEAEDLLLRTCRLVFQDPDWTTSRKPRLPSRVLSGAADQQRFGQVLSALHQAADALARLATADLALIDTFGCKQRFYIPNAILDDRSVRLTTYLATYLAAPPDRVALVVDAYRVVVTESVRAAQVLDELVLRHGAPSTPLALARKAVPRLGATADLDPAVVANRLQFLDRAKHAHGVPRNQIDTEAVVRAYRDEELTVQECAAKFTTSTTTVTKILQAGNVSMRPKNWRRAAEGTAPDPAPLWRPESGPVEQEARSAGITDPVVLARAAEMDQTIARVRITKATSEAHLRLRLRSAAELARLDQAGTAQVATQSVAQSKRNRRPEVRRLHTP
jgi:hypothetical protein